MRIGFALLAALAACGGGDDGGFPVGGGGTDGGFTFPDSGVIIDGAPGDGSTGSDAMPEEVDAAIFTGRVCLASDSRMLDACATTGAGGLTVRLGSSSAVTADDGTFMIAASSATVWTVSGASIVTSVKPIGDYEIPAITRTMFDSMIATNLMMYPPNPGEGHVIAQVVRNGTPESGATAVSPATATWAPFYDGSSATSWTRGSTGANGVVWIPSIDVGTVSVSFTSTTTVNVTGLPVQDGAITFTTVIFP